MRGKKDRVKRLFEACAFQEALDALRSGERMGPVALLSFLTPRHFSFWSAQAHNACFLAERRERANRKRMESVDSDWKEGLSERDILTEALGLLLSQAREGLESDPCVWGMAKKVLCLEQLAAGLLMGRRVLGYLPDELRAKCLEAFAPGGVLPSVLMHVEGREERSMRSFLRAPLGPNEALIEPGYRGLTPETMRWWAKACAVNLNAGEQIQAFGNAIKGHGHVACLALDQATGHQRPWAGSESTLLTWAKSCAKGPDFWRETRSRKEEFDHTLCASLRHWELLLPALGCMPLREPFAQYLFMRSSQAWNAVSQRQSWHKQPQQALRAMERVCKALVDVGAICPDPSEWPRVQELMSKEFAAKKGQLWRQEKMTVPGEHDWFDLSRALGRGGMGAELWVQLYEREMLARLPKPDAPRAPGLRI